MANTLPKPPVHERSDQALLEDLCQELRHVGICDSGLPDGKRVQQHIFEVGSIHDELTRRQLDPANYVAQLSSETNWQMEVLLEECLAYPQKLPYVRERDGIRRTLRCNLCHAAERPPDARLFWYCEACLIRVATALQERSGCEGLVIFRSYTPNSRCAHADAETPLAAEWRAEQIYGVCEQCIIEEIERRRALPSFF